MYDARNTARKAYKEMEDQNLIVTEGNSPSHITTDADVLRKIRSELLGEAMDAFVESVRRLEAPVDELVELVREKYEIPSAAADNCAVERTDSDAQSVDYQYFQFNFYGE